MYIYIYIYIYIHAYALRYIELKNIPHEELTFWLKDHVHVSCDGSLKFLSIFLRFMVHLHSPEARRLRRVRAIARGFVASKPKVDNSSALVEDVPISTAVCVVLFHVMSLGSVMTM